jgi:hypothetical protein
MSPACRESPCSEARTSLSGQHWYSSGSDGPLLTRVGVLRGIGHLRRADG